MAYRTAIEAMNSPRVSTSSLSPLRSASTDNNSLSAVASPVDDSRRNRRNALKEFYNLKKQQQQSSGGSKNSSDDITSKEDAVENFLNSLSDEPEENNSKLKAFLKDCSCYDIVKLENKIHGNVSSSNSMTKNIIYDNYSDLIKINEVLKKMSISEDQLVAKDDDINESQRNNEESSDDEINDSKQFNGRGEDIKNSQLSQLGIIFSDHPNTKTKLNKSKNMKDRMADLNKQVQKFNELNSKVDSINSINV